MAEAPGPASPCLPLQEAVCPGSVLRGPCILGAAWGTHGEGSRQACTSHLLSESLQLEGIQRGWQLLPLSPGRPTRHSLHPRAPVTTCVGAHSTRILQTGPHTMPNAASPKPHFNSSY